jgi:site-specific DNA recombinase
MSGSVLDQLRRARSGEVMDAVVAAVEVVTVGSYARISDAYEDAQTGVTEDGVKRQLAKNALIAEARSWTLAGKEYVDNHVSAFKSVRRDSFEELLDDLEAGVIDGIVCYNLDRFCRRVDDLERAIRIYDEAKKAGRQLHFATAEGDLNLASDDGLTMARVMVAFANKSSRDTARRVALKHQEIRDSGRQVGGSRPFGWDWTREVIVGVDGLPREGRRESVLNETEADAIRQAAAGLIDGSLTWNGVVRLWNDALGLPTPTGRQWKPQTVKQVMRNPRLAGWLVHKGKIAMHSKTGQLIRSTAEAILSDDEYEALLVATQSDRTRYIEASGRHKYLLSGIVRCAECGAKMSGNRRDDRLFYYQCKRDGRASNGLNACGKVACSGVALDELVVSVVLPRVIEETGGVTSDVERPHAARLLELETEKDRLLSEYRQKRAPSEAVFPRVMEIERETEGLRHEQAQWARQQQSLARSEAVTSREDWDALALEERRTHVARHVEVVWIKPPLRNTGRYFDPARAELGWRTTDGPVVPLAAAGR